MTPEQLAELRWAYGAWIQALNGSFPQDVSRRAGELLSIVHGRLPELLAAAEAVAAMERWGERFRTWKTNGRWVVTVQASQSQPEVALSAYDTPTAAILAAAAWLEQEKAK